MPDVVFTHWIWCRALLHRDWWLVTSVYLVVDARLTLALLAGQFGTTTALAAGAALLSAAVVTVQHRRITRC